MLFEINWHRESLGWKIVSIHAVSLHSNLPTYECSGGQRSPNHHSASPLRPTKCVGVGAMLVRPAVRAANRRWHSRILADTGTTMDEDL